MKLGRRTVYALLIALICVNLLARFPRTAHEAGVDSFFIHNLATAITAQGRVPWVLNPLGYFGWYPLSYPTGGPLLLSGLAQAAQLPEEGVILALSIFYGVLGVLVAFAMARAFRPDDAFALTVALIFSLAPRFMSFTLWSASTRNLFMLLIPVFLWALVRSHRKATAPNLFVLGSVLVLMLATHRLTILLAVVVLAFIVAYVFILTHRVLRLRLPRLLLSASFRRWTPRIALIAIVAIAAFMLFGTPVLQEYTQGEVCSGATLANQLCNLGVSITRSVGVALPFVLVGVFLHVREHNKGFLEAFLVLSLLALIPTLFLRQYTGFYIIPFVALFAASGVLGVTHAFRSHRRVRNAVVVASLLVISGFAFAVLQVEVERSTSMSDANYTTALYLQALPEGNFVANDGLLGIRIASISGHGGLPIGGAGTTSQSPELLVYGVYTTSEVFSRERRVPLTELTIEHDSPFVLDGVDARQDWLFRILQREVSDVSDSVIGSYSLQYFLENETLRGAFTAYGNIYRDPLFATFATSVHAQRFKVYDGTTEDLYLAFEPVAR